MKRLIVILGLAASVLYGCSKENAVCLPEGEKVLANITADMSSLSLVKASIDNDGKGIYANQCKMQVWWNGILFCEKTVDVTDFKAKFNDIILIKDQTYDFLFWADNKEGSYYVTDTLMRVRLSSDYVGCDDKRDAFFGAMAEKTVSASFSTSITLRRPFAQLNVISIDIPDVYKQIPDKSEFPKMVPDSIQLSLVAPTVFNVKDSTASAPKTLFYGHGVYTNPYKTAEGSWNTLSMDYFYAPAQEGNVADISFTAKNSSSNLTLINHTFTNIPLRRNYRTNIIGKILTNVADIEVVIDSTWYQPDYYEYR